MAGIADADSVAAFAASVGSDVKTLQEHAGGTVSWSATTTRPAVPAGTLVIFTGPDPAGNAQAGDLWIDAGAVVVKEAPPVEPLFSDTFDGALTTNWTANGAGVTTAGGQLVIPTSGVAGSSYPNVESKTKYVLTGAAFAVDMVQPLPRAGGHYETVIETGADYDNAAGMFLDEYNFQGYVTTAGTRAETLLAAYNGTNDRWWRVRETGGAVYFETSPTGVTWTVKGSASHSWSTASCYLIIKAGYWGAEPPAESMLANEAALKTN